MRFPPFFIGLMTIFWGFCSGWELFSIAAALIFESSNIIKTRFDLKKADFVRISDLSSLVMIIILFYSWMENEPQMIFLGFLAMTPIVFMPLLFAQLFSTSDMVVIGTNIGKGVHSHAPVDARKLYLFAVLIASAAANVRSAWFAAGFLVIVFIAFSGSVKSAESFKRYFLISFITLCLAAGVGAAVYAGHMFVRERMMLMYREWYESVSADPFKTSTAMGEIGRQKLSGEIAARVYSDKQLDLPIYLKQSDYDNLSGNSWYSRSRKTVPVFADRDMEWQFFGEGEGDEKIKISAWMTKKNGEGVLPLPEGSKRALEMDVAGIEKSRLGSIYVKEGPQLLDFVITYDPKMRFEPLPGRMDLHVPRHERRVIYNVMREFALRGDTPRQTLENIERFLAGFDYTLDQKNLRERRYGSYMNDFLNVTRAGHCEYFATATVLMLRSAGIAARYRIGYMIDEYSPFEEAYIARKRDAHAWVIAYIDGKWIDIDTTPPQWKAYDESSGSFFEPVSDFFSWLNLKYEEFRRKKSREFNLTLIITATVLTLLMMIKVYLRRRRVKEEKKASAFAVEGSDSPFYRIMDFYLSRGLKREDCETLRVWTEKNINNFGCKTDIAELVRLHEKLRFDSGIDKKAVLEELLEKCRGWEKEISDKRIT